jgi:hypothetical protein
MNTVKTLGAKRSVARVLQAGVVLLGVVVAGLLLWEPWVEGVNAHATSFLQIYFDDAFLLYLYVGSVAFFVALYQAYKLLSYVGSGAPFSLAAVRAVRNIRRCALIGIAFLIGAEAYISIVQRTKEDDIAGGVMMGLALMSIATGVVIITRVIEKKLRRGAELRERH